MALAALHEKKIMNASGNEAHADPFFSSNFSGLSFFMDFEEFVAPTHFS